MNASAIITCFSYIGNSKYEFNPEHLRSDLCRIITLAHNQTGCPFKNIYVLTDLCPVEKVKRAILDDFKREVLNYLDELGIEYKSCLDINSLGPLIWLQSICPAQEYKSISTILSPVIRRSNVIELASLFTNFYIISGIVDFEKKLSYALKHSRERLLFYYTGHCVKLWSGLDRKPALQLVIPYTLQRVSVQFYPQRCLQNLFMAVFKSKESVIIFDCCHAEKLLDIPESNKSTIYIASTQDDQTCGFYINNSSEDSRATEASGSLFTHYLTGLLNSVAGGDSVKFTDLKQIEEQIQCYRKSNGKTPQNICISLSNKQIKGLYHWLFSGIYHRSLFLSTEN